MSLRKDLTDDKQLISLDLLGVRGLDEQNLVIRHVVLVIIGIRTIIITIRSMIDTNKIVIIDKVATIVLIIVMHRVHSKIREVFVEIEGTVVTDSSLGIIEDEKRLFNDEVQIQVIGNVDCI